MQQLKGHNMQFLKDIRAKVDGFESEAKEEIHRFIDYLHTIFVEPSAPVGSGVTTPEVDNSTFTAPVPAIQQSAPVVEEAQAPVVEEAQAPVVEEAQAPVVEETPAPVVEEAQAPVVEETPAPVVEETPAPVETETAN